MSEANTKKLRLGNRERILRVTQRTKFRLSQSGLTVKDFENPQMGLRNVCVVIHALVDEPNFDMTFEDIAVDIEGNELKAAEIVSEALVELAQPSGGEADPNASGPMKSLSSACASA